MELYMGSPAELLKRIKSWKNRPCVWKQNVIELLKLYETTSNQLFDKTDNMTFI